MLSMLKKFSRYYRAVFSMNLNEARQVCQALGQNPESPRQAGQLIHRHCEPVRVVIHLLDSAYCFDDNEQMVPGRKVERPMISTGGGDNFNAGLTWGLLQGFSLPEAAVFANAAGGFFVAKGKSPDPQKLTGWLVHYECITGDVGSYL